MKQLIKKHQYGGGLNSLIQQQDPLKLSMNWSKELKFGLKNASVDFDKKQKGLNTLMNMQSWNAGIAHSSSTKLTKPTSVIQSGTSSNPTSALAGVGSEILGEAPQLLETGLQAVGMKRAETGSGLEEGAMGLMDKGAGMMLKSGNPALMGIGAGLTALTTLNKFAGTTAKKQGTVGMDTGAYSFNMNTNAGKKQTLLGTWGGKTKNANNLTKYYDKQNLLAGNSMFQNKQNMLASQNSFGDVATKNQQKLFGGITTNILAAKRGSKLQMANIKNRVNYSLKVKPVIEVVEVPEIDVFEDGGKFNVIPDGALHARKHDLPEEIAEHITDKGIPVITMDDGGAITQHAEIELNEIIFNKDVTDKLEEMFKQYKDGDEDIALKAGKLLVYEILENTQDNTGLIETIEA